MGGWGVGGSMWLHLVIMNLESIPVGVVIAVYSLYMP